MPASRYNKTPVLEFGRSYGTSQTVNNVRYAIKYGALPYSERLTQGAERLDVLAGQIYGDGRHWWILAAASDIGWGLQVPPGTIIKVPRLEDVLKLIS